MSAVQELLCRSCEQTSPNLFADGICPACLFLPIQSELAPATHPDELIAGKYLLGKPLGKGGMGEVFWADQIEPVERSVAIKIIKRGMDSEEILNRFEAERQILALLDHPHISRILDGGILPDGRSYFVMELAGEEPVTEWIRRNPRSLRERVGLFRKIASAIAHAHQKGIIHRDLKPSNILMKGEDPTVIDFGIAKVLDQKISDHTLVTRPGHVIGTPAYMSPEQARGDRQIDTRTDLYGLGAVFYELLTGKPPFDPARFKSAGPSEIEQIITTEKPLLPSKITKDPGLQRELDWIVMKCLEKYPKLRYQTSEALIDDLDAYLQDETVIARPPSFGYRTAKLISRHRVLLGTTALVVAALATGLILSQIEARKAREARDEMATVKNASETLIADVVSQLYPEAQKTGNNTALIRSAKGIKAYLDQLPEDNKEEWGVINRHAEAYFLAGQMLVSAGDFENAAACYRSETTLRKRLISLDPVAPRARYKLGTSLNASGWCAYKTGDAESARALFKESIPLHRQQINVPDPDVAWIAKLQRVNRNLALAEQALENREAAHEAALRSMEASDRFRKHFPDHPAVTAIHVDATEILALTTAHIDKEKALELAREAVRHGLADTESDHYETGLAESWGTLADALAGVGQYAEALAETEKVIEVWEKYSREQPEIGNLQTLLADQLAKKARFLQELNRPDEARAIEEKAITQYEVVLKLNPGDPHALEMISEIAR